MMTYVSLNVLILTDNK